jgi:hypothetical protein
MMINNLIEKLNAKKIWDEEPVFCFTSDIDWASEDAIEIFLNDIVNNHNLKIDLFVTHKSDLIQDYFEKGKINRGIHPNFLSGSSHGNSFEEIIETVKQFAPETNYFRCHRYFDVTDISLSLLKNHNFKFFSNYSTIFQSNIKPFLHFSSLIQFPVFFEDGTHLFNNLSLNFDDYKKYFETPGLKIISFHPMNYVLNIKDVRDMRKIKDSLSRDEYNNFSKLNIEKNRNRENGITDFCYKIFDHAAQYKQFSLTELYLESIK